MKIGIIGAGFIGGNLTRRLTSLGHEVAVANSRGPESLTNLIQETGAKAVKAGEAAQGAQIVIVTIPLKSVPELPADLLNGAAPDVAVMETGNYYAKWRDGCIPAIEEGMIESRWTEQQLGHHVIKAFNTTPAHHLLVLPQPKGSPVRVAVPVAGDDQAAKQRVCALVDELGFDPVDAGGLDDSWRQQPGTPIYATAVNAVTARLLLAQATPGRKPEWRA
ncbi:NADPH-dependent F420 reductase [Streptomyces sioyaensis]|uniref:NADPH-dependent F420 reductase n=1 Tax=Streptomyces sioyaensis TaxID=67364 RepID=UPI0037D84C54